MNEQIPDRFSIPFYTLEEIIERGYTVDDCVTKDIKDCMFYLLKTDVAAELEWAKKRFAK